MFKKIWAVIQLIVAALFVAVLYLFAKNKVTINRLDKVQKKAEKEAKEKYETMSNDDIVDGLVNANDIRNADGIPDGIINSETVFRNRSKSLLSWLGSKGVRREDIRRSDNGDAGSVSPGED